jgi:FtsP/CotA-like multicopper oxidase with cupredoxin domain
MSIYGHRSPSTPPGRTRRDFLAVGASGAALVALAACGGSRVASLPDPGGELSEPRVLRSEHGRLDVTLVAAAGSVAFGNRRRDALTYTGASPGPTLRLRPGDRLTITLVNHLDEPTNLHTHGLHVSPSGQADNVFVTVAPGARRRYEYDIPADHRSGLFWYHPHHHHTVAAQVFRGLAGAIVIEDDVDAVPELAASHERILVLSDPPLSRSRGASMMQQMLGREGDEVLVNGALAPRLVARAGELQRWRLLNASPSRYHRLSLTDHDLHLVATDGGRLASPVTRRELLLAPGERAEVLVAPSRRGSYALVAGPYDRGSPMMGGAPRRSPTRLATLVVRGNAAAAELPATLATVEDLRTARVDRTRTLTLGTAMGMGGGMGGMGGGMRGMGEGSLTIDGRSFDARRDDITARLDTVEDWIVRNPSSMDHPFHLHVWPFQVLDGGDGTPTLTWKDTVNVPAGGHVRLRVAFRGPAGRTVYHCHILDHEDLGMMGVIRVV